MGRIDAFGVSTYGLGMLKEERFNLILKAVEGRDAVSYEELLTMVDASGATLRRDVDQLCDAGRIRKVRGGVAPLMAAGRPLASYFFGVQAQRAAAAKEAIARRAAALVSAPDTLILYGGSTVARFCGNAASHRPDGADGLATCGQPSRLQD